MVTMDFTALNIEYLEGKTNHKKERWSCYECNCRICPFEKSCTANIGNPEIYYELAIKKITELEKGD